MTQAADQVLQSALALSPEERRDVLEELLRSLDGPEAELDQSWMDEIQRRIDEIESGAVQMIPAEEVFSRMDERARGRKSN